MNLSDERANTTRRQSSTRPLPCCCSHSAWYHLHTWARRSSSVTNTKNTTLLEMSPSPRSTSWHHILRGSLHICLPFLLHSSRARTSVSREPERHKHHTGHTHTNRSPCSWYIHTYLNLHQHPSKYYKTHPPAPTAHFNMVPSHSNTPRHTSPLPSSTHNHAPYTANQLNNTPPVHPTTQSP